MIFSIRRFFFGKKICHIIRYLHSITCRSNGSLIATLSGHTSWVLSVAFSPDNEHFVSGSSDRTVKVWEVATKQCIHTFSEHSDQGRSNFPLLAKKNVVKGFVIKTATHATFDHVFWPAM